MSFVSIAKSLMVKTQAKLYGLILGLIKANFSERRLGEVRRIYLPRRWVHRAASASAVSWWCSVV
jgi:hypothetical protein